MLVMRRREGEAILIGDEVEVRILSVEGTRVKIGINAPRSIRVRTLEADLVRDQNLAAAQSRAGMPGIVAQLVRRCIDPPPAETSAGLSDEAKKGVTSHVEPDTATSIHGDQPVLL
jgi:carbon storage regulator